MTRTIKAVFEHGIFRPVEPVALNDGEDVELTFRTNDEALLSRTPTPEENQRVIDAILEIASLPDGQDDDGTGGDKHDEILYGSQDDLP